MKKIILNCLPPASIEYPSPGLSILKSFLLKNGFETRIIYWNILTHDLLTGFKRDPYQDSAFGLLPFLSLLIGENNDESFNNRIKAKLFSKCDSPEILEKIKSNIILEEFKNKLYSLITSEYEKINPDETLLVGFTSRFGQWIPATILSSILKSRFKNIKTVIGGFSNKSEAISVIKGFNCFDFAIWGEGEYPLVDLCNQLLSGCENYDNISRLIYRKENDICISKQKSGKYLSFDQILTPNYDDFFSIPKKDPQLKTFIPFETTRGCHWNKCKFCVESEGIKYRQKSPQQIIDEMEFLAKQYKINKFEFLDSDTVGRNIKSFESFLDKLITLKIDQDISYEILHAEINPNKLNSEIIKKITLAGFKSVQVGFEAVTDSLLKKMDKKNTCAENILFIKFALKYGLKVTGANIIIGILNEEENDIYESIQNLHYFRFFLKKGTFELKKTYLELCKGSYYFKSQETQDLDSFDNNDIFRLLPNKYINYADRFDVFGFYNNKINELWHEFIKLDEYYTDSNYSYRLIKNNENIHYEEYFMDIPIKSFVFNEPEYFDILRMANNEVVCFDDLFVNLSKKYNNISRERLLQILSELKSEYLLYSSNNNEEFVSIVDTSNLN